MCEGFFFSGSKINIPSVLMAPRHTVQQVRCFPFYCVHHVNRSDNALKAAAHVNASKQQLHDRKTQSLSVRQREEEKSVRYFLLLAPRYRNQPLVMSQRTDTTRKRVTKHEF